MEPRLFLKWLLERHGENTSSLARKLHGNPSQQQIHRFLSGVVKEPNRAMLATLASHFCIPLEALYDQDEADKAKALIEEPTAKPAVAISNKPTAPMAIEYAAINNVVSLDAALNSLSVHLAQVDASKQSLVIATLSAIVQAPDDLSLRASLTALLTPSGFTETQRKIA